jgi:hypothetical protein
VHHELDLDTSRLILHLHGFQDGVSPTRLPRQVVLMVPNSVDGHDLERSWHGKGSSKEVVWTSKKYRDSLDGASSLLIFWENRSRP